MNHREQPHLCNIHWLYMSCSQVAVGILRIKWPWNATLEGKEFRNYTEEERMNRVDNIRVMARSSPSDKLLMVQCLKKKGHKQVAFHGHCTNEAPAIKEADIGICSGIQGTKVAKESADIVTEDDDFVVTVKGVRCGRSVFHKIQQFTQFQLPPNLAAFVVNFISDACGRGYPLTAVHMLWVNLIMIALFVLALAPEKPTKELMKKPPVIAGDAFHITNDVWRNSLAQSLLRIVIVLTFWFKGRSIFNVNERVMNTMFFNTFVFCQLFNLFNARKLEEMNIFEGLHKNMGFLGIVGVVMVLQVVLMEFLKIVADTGKLNVEQLGICIAFASLSWPVGWFVKLITVALSCIRSRVVDLAQVVPKDET